MILLDKIMLHLPRMQCKSDAYVKMVAKYWNIFTDKIVQQYTLE